MNNEVVKEWLKPNTTVAKAIIARLASMTPAQKQTLKGIVTSENREAFSILLPEFANAGKGVNNG